MRLPKDVSGKLIAYSVVPNDAFINSSSMEVFAKEYKMNVGVLALSILAILINLVLIAAVVFGIWHYMKVSNPLNRSG